MSPRPGVTCYTCHRGQPVPANIWFNNPGPVQAGGFAQVPAGKNHPDGGRRRLVAAVRSVHAVPGTGQRHPRRVADGIARHRSPVDQADRLDLRADDELFPVTGRQLHLLPQHPVIHRLGTEHAAARDGLVWHSNGSGPEHELPRSAARQFPASSAGAAAVIPRR